MLDYISNFDRLLGEGSVEGSQVVYSCPLDGCLSTHKKKLYVDPETGLWYCHLCQTGGNWRKLAEILGDSENTHLWPEGRIHTNHLRADPLSKRLCREIWGNLIAWSSLLSEHREKIYARGIDPDIPGYVSASYDVWCELLSLYGEQKLIRAGLAAKRDDHPIRPTRCVQEGRILLPYWAGERVRYFVGYDREHEVKYSGPAGCSPQVYGEIPVDAPWIIIHEAQFKAEAAIQRGFASIGISGIGNSHKDVAYWLWKKRVSRAFILFDTQTENQQYVDKAADQLAEILLRRKIQTFRAYLPLESGETKIDTDAYLLKHSDKEFRSILMDAAQRPYLLEEDYGKKG